MCIIAACNKKKLSELQIWYCWTNNPDGAGIAWIHEGRHFYTKGYMTYDDFIQMYKQITILPHVVHFRTASSGYITPSLTHPFVCSEKVPKDTTWEGEEQLIFHNGIISGWEMMARLFKIDTNNLYWSDTRLLSLILSQYTAEEIILPEKTGKFILFREGKMYSHGKFELEDGIKFSNTGYKEDLYEYYFVVSPEGNKSKHRRKKVRNLCNNRNVTPKSGGQIDTGIGGNYTESGIQQNQEAGYRESYP